MVGDKFDLTLPIFKHWNKIFHKYGYQLINIYYYSSNYSEDSVCILQIDKDDDENVYEHNYPCLVHGWGTKRNGFKVKRWKNLGGKFTCDNSKELNKLLKQFINELNTGKKSKKYIQGKQKELKKIAEELNNLYIKWEE